ncbi:MAG TPA: type II toxin-antitoxin system prevent-host-death family antitoxin [Candidatus Binatia bacterium]|nr:type II toxin-antitoxin system prevent-host-death family antitoxin [Candidatus Binatia bacterium]
MVMMRAKVSDLKAHLSSYLAQVRRGETVVVCDRDRPIARLVPWEATDDLPLVAPSSPPFDLARLPPIRLRRRIDVVRLLREDREQR